LASPAEKQAALAALAARIKAIPFDEALGVVEALFEQIPDRERWEQRSTLDWEELRALDRQGATIAAHTHTHPLLSRIPFERACAEIRLSQEHIRREIGRALPVFAFPDGRPESFTPGLVDFLRGEGFKFVMTTVEGSGALTNGQALRFPRLAVWPTLEPAAFHYHLTPFYNWGKRGD
jgi:hypothetical protein